MNDDDITYIYLQLYSEVTRYDKLKGIDLQKL